MNQEIYLVDNNALTAITAHRIRSEFFRSRCRITADVLWEAREHPEFTILVAAVKETTPAMLVQLKSVVGTVGVGHTNLIDLYQNHGAADPGLIASILESTMIDEGTFFSDTWVLVTNDHAVEELAAAFNIVTVKPEALSKLIDASVE